MHNHITDGILSVKLIDAIGSSAFGICFLLLIFQQSGGEVQQACRIGASVSAVVVLAIELWQGKISIKFGVVSLILSSFIAFDALLTGAKELLALMQLYIALILGLYLKTEKLLVGVARFVFWTTLLSMALLFSASPNNELIFPNQGRNFCGAYALMAYLFLAVALRERNHRITKELVLSAAACLCLSMYTIGRGSILACALLFVLVVGLYLRERGEMPTSIAIVAFVGSCILVGLLAMSLMGIDVLSTFFGRFGSYSAERSDAARSLLYTDYLAAIAANPTRTIFGINPMLIHNEVIYKTGGNLHCSYLQWHANFGLLGLLILVTVLLKGTKLLYKEKNFAVFAAVVAIFARALTDTMFVGCVWDTAIFYLVFTLILPCEPRENPKSASVEIGCWQREGFER